MVASLVLVLLLYTFHNRFREAALEGRRAVFSLYAHRIPDNATTLDFIKNGTNDTPFSSALLLILPYVPLNVRFACLDK